MATAMVKIPVEKWRLLQRIAHLEGVGPEEILSQLIDYAARHCETLDLLTRAEWAEMIARGKAEVSQRVEGKGLDELAY